MFRYADGTMKSNYGKKIRVDATLTFDLEGQKVKMIFNIIWLAIERA